MNKPSMLAALVDYYGPERVWKCAIEVLGFPATWTTTIVEANAVGDRLRKESP